MAPSARKAFASVLLVAVVFFQFAPLTIHADDTAPATTDATSAPADTGSSSTATDSSASATQSAAPTDSGSATGGSTATTGNTSSTATGTGTADSTPPTTSNDTVPASDSSTSSASTGSASGATSDSTSTASDAPADTGTTITSASGQSAPQAAAAIAAPAGDPSSSSSSSSASDSASSSTSDAASSTSASVDATSTGASQSEQHDNLSIHATSTDPAFSINGVLDSINNIATTSQAGAVSGSGSGGASGGGSVGDVASNTPTLDFQPNISTTSTPSDSNASNASTTIPDIASTTPTIVSGAATAIANILNILNSTFVNSNGAILFQNFTDPAGNIDFRQPALFLGLCGTSACSGSSGLQINLLQDGKIDNNLFISANSGQNDLQSNTAGAILTGDALAGLNLVNLANVTIANSNYLLIALNAFRGVNGDIIFPALANFFAPLLNPGATQVAGLANSATVDNDVTTGANAGDNTASTTSNGSSTILTGAADAHTNVFNQINSLLAGSGLSLFFRISGDWNGEVQGLPAGVSWVRTPDGILITGNATGTDALGPLTTISGTSTADIANHAQIGALSGGNAIGASTTALISTGDSLAGANIINIANQTVIGRNWMLAIINIFGNFTGNISFGRPDLWVGSQVQAPAQINPGDTLTYKVTVINNGDAQATLAKLREAIDTARVQILNASLPFTMDGSTMVFDLGTLAPGASQQITYTAQVTNFAPGDSIVSQSDAILHENDNNPADNTDSTTVQDIAIGGGSSGYGYGYTGPITPNDAAAANTASSTQAVGQAILSVTRTSPTIVVQTASTTATETILVKNTSAVTAQGVKLNDVIRDDQGGDVHEEMFDIGSLAPGEAVSISYDITFHEMGHGRYTLWSEIGGENVGAQIYQNGDITFLAPAIPAPVFPSTTSTTATDATDATVAVSPVSPLKTRIAEPLVPNTGSWTESNAINAATAAQDPGNPAQAAAAGSVDSNVSDMYMKLVSFGLLLLSIFGALRAFVFRF